MQITGEGAAGGRFRRVLKLNDGSVDLDLQKLEGGKVEVETPTAVCGAVGTRFTVDARSGRFAVSEGSISASSKGDATFVARRVSGTFTLQPGRENAFVDAQVSGDFTLNGVPVSGSGLGIVAAKARGGTGAAAVRITGGSLADAGAGSYPMEGGKLTPVDPGQSTVHGRYLAAAGREGSLNLRRQTLAASGAPVPASLEAGLAAAAREATALRQALFARQAIRDAAQEAARDATRSNARPGF